MATGCVASGIGARTHSSDNPCPMIECDFYRQWSRLVPLMKELVEAAGTASWEQLQVSEDLSLSRAFYQKARERAPLLFMKYKAQRYRLRRSYAYSVPSIESLNYVRDQQQPILEIASGSGYWARRLREANVTIVASDALPPQTNTWVSGAYGFIDDVIYGHGIRDLIESHEQHLVLVGWIPRGSRGAFAHEILNHYQGPDLLIIGEAAGGSTASPDWFARIKAQWRCITRTPLPRFAGVMDSLYHYRKRG
jgi:hypothetical protein